MGVGSLATTKEQGTRAYIVKGSAVVEPVITKDNNGVDDGIGRIDSFEDKLATRPGSRVDLDGAIGHHISHHQQTRERVMVGLALEGVPRPEIDGFHRRIDSDRQSCICTGYIVMFEKVRSVV